jgi:N-formylmaleamate deformylase
LQTIKKQLEEYIIDQKLENVILVGHSIGGFLSLCIASEMKAHLQKIVVVDALPFYAAIFNPNAADTFNEKQAQNMFAMYSKMDDDAFRKNQMSAAKFLCRDSTKWDMIATWGAKSDRKTFAYTVTEMMGTDMRKKISDIQVPVLVLGAYCQSAEYPGYTRESVVKSFSEQYSACTTCSVKVSAGGTRHFIMYEDPEWYFAEIDNFLKN